MQLGTGLQNKLLEAMSMQLPCITSSLCNSALMAQEGKEILIGNTAEEVAEQTIRLLDDVDLAKTIANNGSHFVRENYTWESATNKLSKLIESTSYIQ
jgi:glycosyltransferase involved in cell wall biosynthesis